MRANWQRLLAAGGGALLIVTAMFARPIAAQPVQLPPQPSAAAPGSPVLLSPAQLDQLTAPIALYPDPLLGEILAAATYPLEIVEAVRWLNDPSNAALRGDDLVAALQSQPWDPSVKALVAFPDVLRRMDSDLEWTEAVGDAFLAQQADVMDSVQRLRARAAASGSLQSTPQETIGSQDGEITIEPTNPDVVYVPYYVPSMVFGPWPWPDFAPYFFPPPAEVVYAAGLIGFAIGIPIIGPLWGGYGWNWRHHGFNVIPRYPTGGRPFRGGGAGGRAPPGGAAPRGGVAGGAARGGAPAGGAVGGGARPWTHDPAHRGGVPYRTPAVAARFGGQQTAARSAYRGFPAGQLPAAPSPARGVSPPAARPAAGAAATGAPIVTRPGAGGQGGGRPGAAAAGGYRGRAPATSVQPRSVAPAQRQFAPAFESFGRGAQVRGEAARGVTSRSAPAPAPRAPAGGARGGPPGRGRGH